MCIDSHLAVEAIRKAADKYGGDTRIDQFLSLHQKITTKLRQMSTDVDCSGDSLDNVLIDLKNFEEVDLLIFTSIELSELEDEDLSYNLRKVVVDLENEKNSLILHITSICPDAQFLPNHRDPTQMNGFPEENQLVWYNHAEETDRISVMTPISEDSEEYNSDTQIMLRGESNSAWSPLRIREDIAQTLYQIRSSPFDGVVEGNFLPHFLNQFIEDFMERSTEVINHVSMSREFVYIQKSRILKLILLLCAINCKFHGLDLDRVDGDELAQVVELMHYELCLSTSLLSMFQQVVSVEETQLIDQHSGLFQEGTYLSLLQSLDDLYQRDISLLEQSMSILLLHRLHYFMSRSPRRRPSPQHWVGWALLLCWLVGFLLCSLMFDSGFLRMERFGERPQ